VRDTKIPFGERDGVMLRAFEVENGLACNCICPGCRKALIAANGGLKVIPHFRHVQAEDCWRGYKEGVRRAAIAVIAKYRPLWLPAFSGRESAAAASGKVFFRDIGFSAKPVAAEVVERFVDLGDVRAHAVLTVQGHRLLVRIKISPRAEHARYELLRGLADSSLEIDLSNLSLEQISDPKVFETAVLADHSNRSWIRSLRSELLAKRAQQELEADVQVENDHWEKEQARREAFERAEQEKKAVLAQARATALEGHRQEQLAKAEEQRAAGIPGKDDRGARVQREELIIRQTIRAAQEWGGKAVECSACLLLNPPGSRFCSYCSNDASTMFRVLISSEVATTIHHRMRSSAKPDRSLRAAPVLLVQPDPFKIN